MRYVRKGAGVLRHFGQQSASSPNRSMVTTVESMVAGQKTTHDLYSRLRSQRSHLNLTFPREGGYPPRATVSQSLTNHCGVISRCGRERNLRNPVTGAKFPAHFRLIFAANIVIVSQHKLLKCGGVGHSKHIHSCALTRPARGCTSGTTQRPAPKNRSRAHCTLPHSPHSRTLVLRQHSSVQPDVHQCDTHTGHHTWEMTWHISAEGSAVPTRYQAGLSLQQPVQSRPASRRAGRRVPEVGVCYPEPGAPEGGRQPGFLHCITHTFS